MPSIYLAQAIGLEDAADPPKAIYISQRLDYFLVAEPRYWAEKIKAYGSPFRRLCFTMWRSLLEEVPLMPPEEQQKALEVKAILDLHPHLLH